MKTKKRAVEKLTMGMDLGDRRHHVCVLDGAGDVLTQKVIVSRERISVSTSRSWGSADSLASAAQSLRLRRQPR